MSDSDRPQQNTYNGAPSVGERIVPKDELELAKSTDPVTGDSEPVTAHEKALQELRADDNEPKRRIP
ncbi:hypothetical protein PYCC9005_004006 [Savitreella phatthalungensis]